jgi:putative hemolysin
MSAILILQLAALVTLLVFSAFFSSAETALFSINPIQIHRIGKRSARKGALIAELLKHPTHLLSTILIGNTLVNIAASALGYIVAERLVPRHGEAVAIPIMTVALLLFGEVTPKRLAMSHAEAMSAFYAPVLRVLITVLRPCRVGLDAVTLLFRGQFRAGRRTLTEDEFLTVVEVGEEEGVLDEEERTMVDGIIRLEETQASEVMTPRVDLVGIDLDDPPAEHERVARSVRFRYLPLYRDSLDHIEGFLDVPRYLLARERSLDAARVGAFFVPETAPLDSLLSLMQHEHHRIAVVADEFGGTAGVITRGDILEEIADDVGSEFTEERPAIEPLAENRWLINGSTSLDDINYELDTDLQAEGVDRIAGWVTDVAERIPKVGETVEAQECRVTVQRVRHQRITLVLLERLPRAVEPSGEEEQAP